MARRITLALCALTTAFQTPPLRPRTRLRATATGEWDLSLFSPAKINLFLRIIKKRDDGFHELASLFQAIDLGDVLSFEKLSPTDDDILECETEGMPLDSTNTLPWDPRSPGPPCFFLEGALEAKRRKIIMEGSRGPHGFQLGPYGTLLAPGPLYIIIFRFFARDN